MADTPHDNNRVTLAEIKRDIAHLTESNERQYRNLNRRLDFLEEKVEINVSEVRGQCNENRNQIARLDERQKAWTGILGALTMIGTTIGSAFGFLGK